MMIERAELKQNFQVISRDTGEHGQHGYTLMAMMDSHFCSNKKNKQRWIAIFVAENPKLQ